MKSSKDHQLLYPFHLRGMLRGRLRIVNWIPLIDLCMVACLFAFLKAEFIFSPGMALELPKNMSYSQQGIATSEVVTISGTGDEFILIFDHHLFQGISEWENYLKNDYEFSSNQNPALMIKANSNTNMELVMSISSIAERNGFETVLIATVEN